jgi:ankyrin repeat protein
LVSDGVNVNCKANDGQTPLHLTSSRGHLEAAFSLIDLGADLLSIKDNSEKTADDVAKNKNVSSKLACNAYTIQKDLPRCYARQTEVLADSG